jgi:hypothetical protein
MFPIILGRKNRKMKDNPIQVLDRIRGEIRDSNLIEMAKELLELNKTGVLPSGYIRKYSKELESIDGGYFDDGLKIIKSIVVEESLERVSKL